MRLTDANMASLVSAGNYYDVSTSAYYSSVQQCKLTSDPLACYQQLRMSTTTTTQAQWDEHLNGTGTGTQGMAWETLLAVMHVAGIFLFPFFALSTAAVRLEGVRYA